MPTASTVAMMIAAVSLSQKEPEGSKIVWPFLTLKK
jgi:hypothetical protein